MPGAGREARAAGYTPWFRMWSRSSRSVANLLEQCEHWKRCSGGAGRGRGVGEAWRWEPPRQTEASRDKGTQGACAGLGGMDLSQSPA